MLVAGIADAAPDHGGQTGLTQQGRHRAAADACGARFHAVNFLHGRHERPGRRAVGRAGRGFLQMHQFHVDVRAVMPGYGGDALPRGGNDSRGNWIRVRAQQATFSRPPDRRVGNEVIEIFTKVNRLFVLTFTGRVTAEEREALIPSWTINPNIKKV